MTTTTQHLRRAQAARASSSSSSSAGVVEGESWASEEVLSKLEPLIRAMEEGADLSPLAHHCNPMGGHCKCLARWLGPEAEQRCQHLRELEQQDRDTATADQG